ncbi:MAG TPA: DUF1800 domain-containing protein [Jatrophihabitantaceae bacterium]|jgi:uncharacterized protein (DUF1800 family)
MSHSAGWTATARLLRRAGFGTTGAAVDAAVKTGPAAYVRAMLAADPDADAGAKATSAPSFDPVPPVGKNASKDQRQQRNKQLRAQLTTLTAWWVRRMVRAEQPFGEKLTFCWHNHFATAATKVRNADWMLAQNEKLRRLGRGDFRTLALTMLTDAAMLDWLDGRKNTAKAPNENLSREFMELFALGHGDGYTEDDVRAGATALTGWKIRPDGSTYLNAKQHATSPVTFLGVTGSFDVTRFCDAVLGRPAGPRYLATRWWGQLASNTAPSSALVDRLVAAYGAKRDLAALFTALFTAPEFASGQHSIVVGPVEWLIGVTRALRVPVPDEDGAKKLVTVLRALGQEPFYPPNVGGWPSGQAWLSTAAADLRMRAALALANAGDLTSVTSAASSERVDAAGYLLGVGAWSARSRAVLQAEVGNPPRLVATAVNTPEYLTN